MNFFITGVAGFIGFHLSRKILSMGHRVIGVDNVNDYYDVRLKKARLKRLKDFSHFDFHKIDIAKQREMKKLEKILVKTDYAIHLAAQAGVRYSFENPDAYIHSNITGQISFLETCNRIPQLRHVIYASSSSVYGSNVKQPFSVKDKVENPKSLYGATKIIGEIIASNYSERYKMPTTGFRFFTVYGPWGRPDMAAYIFTKKIIEGKTIEVFNHGKMKRDFTFIDDIVNGIIQYIQKISSEKRSKIDHKVYNLGNNKSEKLNDFILAIENTLDIRAKKKFLPLQPGDVEKTFADVRESSRDFNFSPKTTIKEGIPKFIHWYRDYHKV